MKIQAIKSKNNQCSLKGLKGFQTKFKQGQIVIDYGSMAIQKHSKPFT
jgi:hypothetical protein